MGEDSWGVIARHARGGTLAGDDGRAAFLAIDAWNAEREGESTAAGRTGGCGWEALRDGTVVRRWQRHQLN
jgi:hypothetical protein